jgi:hypothetical protein
LIKGLALFGGASFNHMIADSRDPRFETVFKDFGNKTLWRIGGTYDQHAWIGYQFGLRIF